MTDKQPMLLYTATYDSVSDAMADLNAIEQLHKEEMIGHYDAAVIDQENGKPHVAKRMDRPGVRVIPEWFGGGTLPRKELHEAAQELTSSQAGLIAVGEPTIEKAVDKALTNADKVVKRTVDATTDEVTSELQEALKGLPASAVVVLVPGGGPAGYWTRARLLAAIPWLAFGYLPGGPRTRIPPW